MEAGINLRRRPTDWRGVARVDGRHLAIHSFAARGTFALISLLIAMPITALPTAASAHTVVDASVGARFPYQRWIDKAKVPTPDIRIEVIEEPCPGYPNVNGCRGAESTIYLHPERIGLPSQGPWLFLHEVGHYFDGVYLTDALRAEFNRIFGDSRPWDSPRSTTVRPGPRTIGPPAERFAQAYAECAIKGPLIAERPRHARKYRYRPSPRQHARACALIMRVGGWGDRAVEGVTLRGVG